MYQLTDEDGFGFQNSVLQFGTTSSTVPDELTINLISFDGYNEEVDSYLNYETYTLVGTMEIWLEEFPTLTMTISPITFIVRTCYP